MPTQPVAHVINLLSDAQQQLWHLTPDEARQRILAQDPDQVLAIDGSFALVAQDGQVVRLARSLDRPLRYFLAKAEAGPVLIVADRMDVIRDELQRHGWEDQFHPSYTRMVPAHHITTLHLVGCPDPNPMHLRFFDPPRNVLPADPAVIGEGYIRALYRELERWVAIQEPGEPVGVLFSGGIDSGAVLLCLYRVLLAAGHSPARLKAFTLAVDGGGEDLAQAREFLRTVGLEYLLEVVEVAAGAVSVDRAVAVLEDYKPLDVECGAVNLALLGAIRRRYPEWRLVVDGDGGDENLKAYPIEENSELTIRSVVHNRMLYHEGWGVDSIKHSLVHTGGLSRGCVRSYASQRAFDFAGFSPYTRPAVVAAAEAAPFDVLTGGSTTRLYALKGEIVRAGVEAILGMEMPVYPKRRFQDGAGQADARERLFPGTETDYRRRFADHFAAA